jgi:hypothetical protein
MVDRMNLPSQEPVGTVIHDGLQRLCRLVDIEVHVPAEAFTDFGCNGLVRVRVPGC